MSLTVDIIGAGNVGWHVTSRLKEKGCDIRYVSSEHKTRATNLADKVGAVALAIDEFSELEDHTPVILAVKDDAIAGLSAQLKHRFLIHTSGSVSISELASEKRGVLYPLQTFSKDRKVDWKKIPICIEASEKESYEVIENIASLLSDSVYRIDSDQRRHLHLAAVVVNNFVNFLLSEASDYLEAKELNFELLMPLIEETALKAGELSPVVAQTGPARRNDQKTIERHLEMLNPHPELKALYAQISDQIIQKYHA